MEKPHKLPSGKWRARVNRDGKRIPLGTFATKKEAEEAQAKALLNKDVLARGQVKFWKYAETHLQVEKDRWAKGTWENNVRSYNNHLQPTFGDLKLIDVTPARVKRWWVDMAKEGAPGPGPRRAAYMVLSGIMSAAEADEEINRWRGIKGASKDVSTPRPVAPVHDINLLRMLGADDQTRTILTVLLHSGLRIGEVLALDWEDFADGALHVYKHATRHRRDEPGRKRHPSYNSYQALTGEAVEALEAYKATGRGAGPMWLNKKGEALSYHAWWYRWDALRKAYGMESIHVHDIRATHLTAFREQGATDKEVMERGGHSDYRSMLRYQRPAEERQRELVANLTF